MRLGNDIVDLKIDAEIHPRFVDRILHPVERLLYSGLSRPEDVWRIWAAKEAAFKAHKQGDDCVGFLVPSRWLVDLQLGRVFFGDEEYWLSFEATDDYILATARSEDLPFHSLIASSSGEMEPSEQKTEARRLRAELGLNSPTKDAGGIPRVMAEGHAVPYSLTHHGRYVAVARGL